MPALLPTMAKIILRHLIETPVRSEQEFEARGLEDCRLDRALYALPGQPRWTWGRPGRPRLLQWTPLRCRPREANPASGPAGRGPIPPEDIIIQTLRGWLLIKAQHGTRMDEHGFISGSFTRQYKLPDGIETKDLSAILCHDGILVVEVKDSAGTRASMSG